MRMRLVSLQSLPFPHDKSSRSILWRLVRNILLEGNRFHGWLLQEIPRGALSMSSFSYHIRRVWVCLQCGISTSWAEEILLPRLYYLNFPKNRRKNGCQLGRRTKERLRSEFRGKNKTRGGGRRERERTVIKRGRLSQLRMWGMGRRNNVYAYWIQTLERDLSGPFFFWNFMQKDPLFSNYSAC